MLGFLGNIATAFSHFKRGINISCTRVLFLDDASASLVPVFVVVLYCIVLYTANIYSQFTAVLPSKGGTVLPMTVH